MTHQISMLPLVAVRAASDDEVNELLVRWDHPLGACRRPFGQQGFVFEVERTPVGCAMSASTISDTIRMDDDGRVFGRGEPLDRTALVGLACGLDYETVATEIGATRKSVDNAVQRARRKLSAWRELNAA